MNLQDPRLADRGDRFAARLDAQLSVIVAGLEALYGRCADIPQLLGKLVTVLAGMSRARPPELEAVDLAREASPGWFLSEEIVAAMLYVDRFSADLAGFGSRVYYLKKLGVSYVHLMPCFRTIEGEDDGGYAVSDHLSIQPRLGTMEDLADLARRLHGEGMLLGLDLVLNHTSDEHAWARRALAGEREFQDRYHMYPDRRVPDAFERDLVDVFPDSAPGNFTWRPEIQRWVFTSFHAYQWDLNYGNPAVLLHMIETMLSLANQGVDVLRLDAASFLWKRLGTWCQNEPEAHAILRVMKACCRVVAPAVALKCEAIGDPVQIPKYLGTGAGSECDLAYNASLAVYLWDAIATRNTRLLNLGLKHMQHALPEGSTWICYVRDHDDIGLGFSNGDIHELGCDPWAHRRFLIDYYTGRFPGSPARGGRFGANPRTGDARITGTCASLCGLELALALGDPVAIELSVRKIVLLYATVFSIGGIPLIFSGDELGCTNDYAYRSHPFHHRDSRWMNRPVMDWEKAARVDCPGTLEHRIFTALQKLADLRKRSPECSGERGYQLIDCQNAHLVAFTRGGDARRTLFVANFCDEAQAFTEAVLSRAAMVEPPYDRFSERPIAAQGGEIVLEPYTFLWLSDGAR